jgi:hypothetical protein
MSKLNLTPEEENGLLEILERYLPELENETVHTDNKEFHKFLKDREAFMRDLVRRLKS